MQPRRLWMAVAIGFGLLATAPYRILAVLPPWLQRAVAASSTAAHDVGENAQRTLRPGSVHTMMDNPTEGYLPHQAVMPPFQYNHRPDTAQPPAQFNQPHLYDFMSETGSRDARNPTEGYLPHQAVMPSFQSYHLPEPAEPLAQGLPPQEYHIIPGADNTQDHNAYQSSYAPQHQPDPMDWEPQHAAPQYPAVDPSHPPYPDAQAGNPGYSAANPVQLAAQHPAPVQQEPGPSSRASPFGQAQGDDAASTLYPSTDAVGREGGSSAPGGSLQAHKTRRKYPAVRAGQYFGVEGRKHNKPIEFIAKLQERAKKADPKGFFTLNLIERGLPTMKGSTVWFLADSVRQNIVKELLQGRFHLKGMEFSMPEAAFNMRNRDRTEHAQKCRSVLAESEVWAWEFLSTSGDSFFFDLGDLRFRCQAITHGKHKNKDPEVYNVEVAGASRHQAPQQTYLYVGIAKISAGLFRSTKKESLQRLFGLEEQLKTAGFKGDRPVGGKRRQRGQQEGSSSKRARKGKQQQQPEQLEQQQQQATDTDRRRARKGKQQQQPM